jgi:hypothetical protein
MLFRFLLTALALTTAATTSQADPPGYYSPPVYQSVYPSPVVYHPPTLQPSYQPAYPVPTVTPSVGVPAGGVVTTPAPTVTTVGGTVVTSTPVVGTVVTSAPVVTTAGGVVTTSVPVATSGVEYVSGYTPVTTVATPVVASGYPVAGSVSAGGLAGDGLDEVNAKRAARGLRPFLRDEGLTRAAFACAQFRANNGLFGHTSNDFAFVPAGAFASSAGCAAYPASYGWMSCCVYDNYTYAGAAYVTGRDGKRYMQLFVR